MAKLTLVKPLTFGKLEITSLNFRVYTTADDYLAFDHAGPVTQRIKLIASLTGQDESLVKQLSGKDYRKAVAIVDELLDADEDEEDVPMGTEQTQQSPEQVEAEKK